MTDSDNFCPQPVEIQDFLFKQATIGQICEQFPSSPISYSLIAVDGKRGLTYIGHENKLIVLKPGNDTNPEWKFEIDMPDRVSRVALSCDYSFLAITCSNPSALIYDASSIQTHKLDLLHEIRLSTSDGQVYVTDLKWNPAIPDILCTITSDHTIGCFQVTKDKKTGVQIIGMEKAQGLEALCVSWSPKGKQIVIGCRNGDIIQLKPELKLARRLTGPNPSEGMVISILWISNYQFCACYFQYEQMRINLMIVDAPKGVTIPKFTNYEDITYGTGPMDYLCYYLEYVPEWGIIIAACSNSSEVCVLGTFDNGTNWSIWQLNEDSTVQLPLNRKTKTENYPVGIAIDKSSTQRLPWGPDSTLPNPVPVLRILATSGQLCCYHMVNLRENVPALCSPPSEIIAAPQLRRPNPTPSDDSFNFAAGATSTPRAKPLITENVPVSVSLPIEKPKSSANIFGNPANTNFSFLAPTNKTSSDVPPPQTEVKTSSGGFFNQNDGKSGFFQQENKITKPVQTPQVDLQFKQPPVNQQQPSLSSGFSQKPDIRAEIKVPVIATQAQTETSLARESAKESSQYSEEVKSKVKEAPVYDESLCLEAYYEEKKKFEKELKNQLELPSWDCGTDEERVLIVKKTEEINEFFQELRETTDSLSSDITYLKALLLQSFAWLEESKSKNSANSSMTSRNRGDSSKLADLERRYYYTHSQLMQASKKLDLQWAERNNQEMSRMKMPNLEAIYQSLVRYNQIINQEKKNMDDLSKKWRSIARPASNAVGSNNLTNLDRSMASLNLSHNANPVINEAVIDLRCQNIAKSTKNFSRDKQMKLRDLLSESAPRIIRAARPSAIQDRLEATLLSMASTKTQQQQPKTKPSKPDLAKSSPVGVTKPKTQNPLSSLDNLVSGIPNSPSSFGKSSNSVAPFSTFSSETAQPKSKENITLSFGQQPSAAYSISKPKETISFGGSPQKTGPEFQFTAKSSESPKFSFNPELSVTTTTAKSTGFSFSTPPNFTVPKVDSFKFSTKASLPQAPVSTQGGLDLSNLSFGTKTAPGSSTAFSFGKSTSPQQQLTTPSTPPSSNTSAVSVALFSKSSPEKAPSATASTASMFGSSSMFGGLSSSAGTGSTFKFSPVSAQASPTASPTSTTTSTSTVSSFGGFSAPNTSTSLPSFGGILNATASLSFGTESSTTITPAFGKTTSIFGSTPSTATTSAKSSISVKPVSPVSSPSTSSLASSSSGDSKTTQITSTTAGTSVFGNVSSTTTADQAPVAVVSSSSDSNLFGSKAPTSASASIFGGSTAPTSGAPLFGSASAPVFGGTSATSQSSNVFGATSTSVFGTSSSGGSVFGGTSALFSTLPSTATTTATTSVFGSAASTSAGGSLFGGNTATTTASLFGSTTSPITTASVFGSTASPTTTASVFGNTTSTTTTASLFGSTTSPTTTSSIFGNSATPTTSTSIFGGAAATTSGSIFGSTAAKPAASVFGNAAATTTASVFGSPATTAATTTASVFGSPATTTSASLFGGAAATTTTASVFGGVSSTNTFGGSSLFGSSTAPSGSLFGSSAAATTASSTFGSPVSPTTTSTSSFGAPATTSASLFGSPPASGATFGAVTPQKTGSVFGAPTGGSMFGGSAVLGSGNPVFGAATSPNSAFGQPSGFGQAPSFSTSPTSGFSAFGSPAAFGSAAAPTGFGSPSMLGSTSPPAMGSTSPSNAFNSTFEALGAQSGGLSFGSLAQKTPEPKPQAFQGSSSFSSWR